MLGKMICSKCYKNIHIGEEVQIEDLTICKKCIKQLIEKKVSDRCHTCSRTIHKGDLFYEVSISWNAEYIVGANETKKIIQCDWCYQKWLRKQEKKEGQWKWRLKRLGLGVYVVLLPVLIIVFFWPDLTEKFCKTHRIVRFLLPPLLLVLPFVIYSMISRIGSRYEINIKRNKRNNKKNERK